MTDASATEASHIHVVVLAAGNSTRFGSTKQLVRVNGRPRWNDFLKPDIEAMLEHHRLHADRQQIYWAVLEF